MRVELGERYRDRVTGFEGVATSRTEFLQGCFRVGLERLNDKGDALVALSFDEPNLEKIEPVDDAPAIKRSRRTGGPHDHGSLVDDHLI